MTKPKQKLAEFCPMSHDTEPAGEWHPHPDEEGVERRDTRCKDCGHMFEEKRPAP